MNTGTLVSLAAISVLVLGLVVWLITWIVRSGNTIAKYECSYCGGDLESKETSRRKHCGREIFF